MYARPSTNPDVVPLYVRPHVCPAVGVSHRFDAATAESGEDRLALVAAKPAIATTATTTSTLRRVDVGFATSGACERARAGRALSMILGLGRALARLQGWA